MLYSPLPEGADVSQKFGLRDPILTEKKLVGPSSSLVNV